MFSLHGPCLVGSLVAFALLSASPAGAESPPTTPSHRSHVFFQVGVRSVDFDFTLDERARSFAPEFAFAEHGVGPIIAVGYDAGPRFRARAGLYAVPLESQPSGTHAGLYGLDLSATVPFVTAGPAELALQAGLGAGGFWFDEPERGERAYIDGFGEFGGALRLRLTRWFSLEGSLLYAIHGLRYETVVEEDDEDLRVVGGSAWVRSAGLALVVH